MWLIQVVSADRSSPRSEKRIIKKKQACKTGQQQKGNRTFIETMTALLAARASASQPASYKATGTRQRIAWHGRIRCDFLLSLRLHFVGFSLLFICFAVSLTRGSRPLHDDALPTAAGFLAGLADIHLALGGAAAERARPGRIGRHLLVVPADLADELVEGVFDVDARLGGGFDEGAAKLPSQGLALWRTLVEGQERGKGTHPARKPPAPTPDRTCSQRR
jgi:hypothetical protein